MLRNLIIVAAVVIVFLILRQRFSAARGSTASRRPGASSTESTNTVKCLTCDTYVPVTEAISDGDRHFCCKQHQRDWADRTG